MSFVGIRDILISTSQSDTSDEIIDDDAELLIDDDGIQLTGD